MILRVAAATAEAPYERNGRAQEGLCKGCSG